VYVCVCHGVTEDDVRRHARTGVCTAKELRSVCGMRPGCGSCVRRIVALLAESGATPGAAAAPCLGVADVAAA
jgi:bacterioferritin-associated ferredoxin